MYAISCVFMIMSSAIVSTFAFIDLMMYGTPMMGIILFGCGACFVGGWIELARKLSQV